MAAAEAARAAGAWIAGYIAYEAGYAMEPRLAGLPVGEGPLVCLAAFDGPGDAGSVLAQAEAEAAGQAIVEEFEVRVLEFDDLATVDADEVVVGRAVEEVGVVGLEVAAEVDLVEQAGFDEEGDGPVDGGAGDAGVGLAGAIEEFLGGEMIVAGEGGAHDGVALRGAAQAFFADEGFEAVEDGGVHGGKLGGEGGGREEGSVPRGFYGLARAGGLLECGR